MKIYKNNPIGGEFEIDITLFRKGNVPLLEGDFYSSGRGALYHILAYLENKLHVKDLYLPDYLCQSIIDVATRFKFKIRYYPILENLEVDIAFFEDLDLSSSVVLMINYFGGINLEKMICQLKNDKPSVYIIADQVQAFFSMFEETNADFSFTSFRKQLPVPDGGWVKSKYSGFLKNQEENTFAAYKIAGGVLKKYRMFDCIEDDMYLGLLKKGEELLDSNLKSKISDVTLLVISNLDLDVIAEKRRSNATYLVEKLGAAGFFPIINYQSSMIPLFLPIRLKNRDEIRSMLFTKNIYCPVHWPISDSKLIRGFELAENELSLVVDQRYTQSDMNRIINVIVKHGVFHQ